MAYITNSSVLQVSFYFFLHGLQLSFFLLGTSPHCIWLGNKSCNFPSWLCLFCKVISRLEQCLNVSVDFILFFVLSNHSVHQGLLPFSAFSFAPPSFFSSSRYVWYLSLAELALARSSLLNETLVTPPTLMRWCLISVWVNCAFSFEKWSLFFFFLAVSQFTIF